MLGGEVYNGLYCSPRMRWSIDSDSFIACLFMEFVAILVLVSWSLVESGERELVLGTFRANVLAPDSGQKLYHIF